ncbi:MAG: alcohol dehydrogenase, partial [Propionicimonas sp.]
GVPGISMDAVDVDDARLAHLAAVVAPVAAAHGVPATFRNSRSEPLQPGYSYVAVMVPAPALVTQAVELAADGAIVNAFAGFSIGTMASLDLDAIVSKGIYLVGTSGSRIQDMVSVLAKVEAGTLDTNVSLDAVSGMAGVADALAAVNNRTSGGKIMVYPMLHDLGMVRLADLAEQLPEVAAAMVDGRWGPAAEEALLRTAG